MAVRNLDAIKRHGNMILEQKRNAYNMVKENFWNRVNTIRSCRDAAVDAIDTIKALKDNCLGDKFSKWDGQQNVHCTFCGGKFSIRMNDCTIYYNPVQDCVIFTWSKYGMCESYSTGDCMHYAGGERYLIQCVTANNRDYDNLLSLMAERLQPYLDAYFEWLETI